MTKKTGTPSHVALPLVAMLVYGAKIIYFASDPNLVNATVVNGLLNAFTPILIIWGAILMFKTMEHSGAMAIVRSWLNQISDNPVAQLMVVGWAFSFLIEGASGFGTPAALAAPILVGLGFPPLKVAVFTLIMNAVPVSFGAVGTPIWFGLGQVDLTTEEVLHISFYTALIHALAALVIPVLGLLTIVPWKTIRPNLGFVYISVLGCVIPYVLVASVNYEFPALLGGFIGMLASVSFARKGIGLTGSARQRTAHEGAGFGALTKALFPIWATVLVLVVTRIEQIGLKGLLTNAAPIYDVTLGSLGQFSTSPSLVISLAHIFGADSTWVFQALYVPALIPFFLVSVVSFAVFRLRPSTIALIASETYKRMVRPILALLGALVMVKLLMVEGENAMVIIIGSSFAQATGQSWQYLAAYLGALGAFFSGSATIANLTFAGIQASIAQSLGLDRTVVLSLQAVGAAMGNMVSINNIVAVCSILGVANQEGVILKKTLPPMLIYGVIAAVAGYFLAA